MGVRGVPAVAQANQQQLLFVLPSADMTLTTDQAFTKLFTGTNWIPTSIIARWTSGAFGTACAGGVYTAAAKGGSAIVAAGQSYAALTGSGTIVSAAIALTGNYFTATPILSLTTGNTGALSAKWFIYGVVAD